MESMLGTVSMGVRAPIIRDGDNLPQIVADCIINASKQHSIAIEEKDVVAITESVVARAEGNYVTVDDIASDVSSKFGDKKVGVIFPILSRNRFAMCFKGICRGAKGGVVLQLSLPSDEVGNHLISRKAWIESKFSDSKLLTESDYRNAFGYEKHEFTGVDYIEYYKEVAKNEGCDIEVIFSNDCTSMLSYTKAVLCCDIHTRKETYNMLVEHGAEVAYRLDEICNTPNEKTGYNSKYGLLGSNKADEERIKLFPEHADVVTKAIQEIIKGETGVTVEVMVYGDGAFKDPVGKIWELADPVVSPAYTDGLIGRPNELKLKALADGKYADLNGEELREAIKTEIQNKSSNLVGDMSSEGTTPRQLTDLLGSLSDLTSGSGDKGTPIVWIKGYFKNYSD